MSTLTKDTRWRPGIRKTIPPSPAYASVVAANTAVTLWNTTSGRTAILKKLHVENRQGAQIRLEVGTVTGGIFTASMPAFIVPALTDQYYSEDQIVAVEFAGAISVQASAAGASPADVRVSPEVEEYMGING